MSSTVDASYATSLQNLAPTFQTAINSIISAESQPMNRIQTQKDDLSVRKGIYTDIKTNLDALQSALHVLMSTQPEYGLKSTAKMSITPGTSGATVLTASMTDTAPYADYDISVSQLAKAQTMASDPFLPSPDIALGKTGTFWLGGNGTAGVTWKTTSSTSVTGNSLSNVADGQRELGSGAYSLEVRDSDGVRQFRLVDADGQAVSVSKKDNSGFTSDWQTMTSGTFDTRRGFSLQLDASGLPGSTDLEYTAKGASFSVSASDTLKTIAANINNANQPEGNDFKASLVGRQLVLTATQTGLNHAMLFSADGLGLGFIQKQAAQNAKFNVNGLDMERPSNTNLTDVINGGTLNLAMDAENKTARLSVGADFSKAKSAMQSLVTTYNAAFKQLSDKMALTSKVNTDGTTTYTRGALSGDTVFRSLRIELLDRASRSYATSGSISHLSDIGITLDKDMKMSFDSAKFEDAMKNHPANATALLDTAMGQLDTTLSSFTGSTGSLQNSLKSMDDESKSFDTRISAYQQNLQMRKYALIDQYSQMQQMLAEMGYQAQMIGIVFGTNSTTSTSA